MQISTPTPQRIKVLARSFLFLRHVVSGVRLKRNESAPEHPAGVASHCVRARMDGQDVWSKRQHKKKTNVRSYSPHCLANEAAYMWEIRREHPQNVGEVQHTKNPANNLRWLAANPCWELVRNHFFVVVVMWSTAVFLLTGRGCFRSSSVRCGSLTIGYFLAGLLMMKALLHWLHSPCL